MALSSIQRGAGTQPLRAATAPLNASALVGAAATKPAHGGNHHDANLVKNPAAAARPGAASVDLDTLVVPNWTPTGGGGNPSTSGKPVLR